MFCLFYNWPLTIRRRIRKRLKLRASMTARYWHIGLCAMIGAGIFGIADFIYFQNAGTLPNLKAIWWLSLFVPLFCGAIVTLGCGGAKLWKRIIGATVCGVMLGVLYTGLSAVLTHDSLFSAGNMATSCAWRVFVFAILSPIGTIITELKLPDPDLKNI